MTGTMQRRDKWIPWYFVLFFVVILLVNSVMVTLAVRTFTGTVADHTYETGLAYNRTIEAEQAQEALGWNGEIRYSNGSLSFVLRDRDRRMLTPQKITATFTRPTQAGMDFSMELPSGTAPITFPANGLWEVRIDVLAQGKHYQQAKRINVE